MMPINKVIVTNKTALNEKYGRAGYAKINAALERLVSVDGKRGIKSKVIALDSKTDLDAYHRMPVESTTNAQAAKRAIDAIYVLERQTTSSLSALGMLCHLCNL